MPDHIQHIKDVQRELRKEKLPVFRVKQTSRAVYDANRFIETTFKKENRLVLPEAIQRSIVDDLRVLNQLFLEFDQQCASDYHFQIKREVFFQSIETIQSIADCLHRSVENGFSAISPLGCSLYQSLQAAFHIIQKQILYLEHSDCPDYFPLQIFKSDEVLGFVKEEYERVWPLVKSLLKKEDFKELSHRWTPVQLKAISQCFRAIDAIEKHQTQACLQWIEEQAATESTESQFFESIEIFRMVKSLEDSIRNYDPLLEKLDEAQLYYLDPAHVIDLKGRLYEVDLWVNSVKLVEHKRYELKDLQKYGSYEAAQLDDLQHRIDEELKQLNQLLGIFPDMLERMTSIQNSLRHVTVTLSYAIENAKKSRLTIESFLATSDATQELLASIQQHIARLLEQTQQIHPSFEHHPHFQAAIENFVAFVADQLVIANGEVAELDNSVASQKEVVEHEIVNSSAERREILCKLCEKSIETAASAGLLQGAVENTKLLIRQASQVQEIFQKTQQPPETEPASLEERLTHTLGILDAEGFELQDLLNQQGTIIQSWDWFLQQVLIHNITAQEEYQQALDEYMDALYLQESRERWLQQRQEQKVDQLKGAMSPGAPAPATTTAASATEKSAPDSNEAPSANDPFSASDMAKLKDGCREINSGRSDMILELLQQPHAYFMCLKQLEKEYDPNDEYEESDYLEEVMQSQSPKEFVLSFVRMKLLPNGYFDPYGEKIEYDRGTRSFDDSKERFLKFTHKSWETPMNLFKRILRVLLGYEDPDVLGRQDHQDIISMLKEDYILNSDEQQVMQSILTTLK